MAKKTSPPVVPSAPTLRVARDHARQRIETQITKGNEILNPPVQTEEAFDEVERRRTKWHKFTYDLLTTLFDTPAFAEEFDASTGIFMGAIGGAPPTLAEKVGDFAERLSDRIDCLQSIAERLELVPEGPGLPRAAEKETIMASNNKVFIVHGHNEAVKLAVARFVESLGIKAIILHEQHNAGRTIIEKLEYFSDVGYAVVLLTGDDVGAVKATADKLAPRARQNVVVEMGYFIGKLGRSKVCPLHEEGVEVPSDFDGVVYVPLDKAGAWQLKLAKELKGAGLQVDMNRLCSA